jgi:preprotein translocase subunit SecG
MESIFLIIHVVVSIALIGLILIQQGKGADAGAAFGAGASSTVFGARGSASFLTRTTGALATVFFVTSLSLAYFSRQDAVQKSVTEISAPATKEQKAPVAPPVTPKATGDVPAVPGPEAGTKSDNAGGAKPGAGAGSKQ